MDMIKVDPKLFVTCRLCLEDFGEYQIVPSVQHQIKYCYDIDVQPFDGFPQLICIKCQENLEKFFNLKKILCEKQNNLRSKTITKEIPATCIQAQQNTVSSSQQPSENIENNIKSKTKTKRIINSSDSESSYDVIKTKKKKTSLTKRPKWDWYSKGFQKNIICTVCNSEWSNKKSFYNHYRIHMNLKIAYPNIFKTNCFISLDKIDHKPNITGMSNTVVHNSSKIIEHCNPLYYIRYTKEHDIQEDNNSEIQHARTQTSDTEEEIVATSKRRKRRLLSRSSNDTVVIESNSPKVLSDNDEDTKIAIETSHNTSVAQTNDDQCISIDDSSDSDTDRNQIESTLRVKQPMEAKFSDYKVIQGIITLCVSAYHRKNESAEKSDRQTDKLTSESQLKRKVLGIGRKIINRQGFNWTGLLRYMEHKNLGILWVTKAVPGNHIKESNYIRIMTKLRGFEPMDDNNGWVPVTVPNKVLSAKPDRPLSISKVIPPTAVDSLNSVQPPAIDSAILLICTPPDNKNKLLNANPVANPKQLPRKMGLVSDIRLNKTGTETFHNNENTDLCMPIITSTTSLAIPSVEERQNGGDAPSVGKPSSETPAPRIKVKPYSELMSEKTLNSLMKEQSASNNTSASNMLQSQPGNPSNVLVLNENVNNITLNQNVWAPQSVSNVYTPNIMSTLPVGNQPIQLVPLSCLNTINIAPAPTYQNVMTVSTATSNNSNNKEEYVLLNTVELPNTTTNSPFTYFKNLSRIHNLILFDPPEMVSREFYCLIKFKVQFKQEPIEEPVVLCLSLYCYENKFCFTVRDRNQKDININKISPNWQWEILNVFRGDLVDKVLQNAQKHSKETHDYTNKFLCLLKSIDFQKLS